MSSIWSDDIRAGNKQYKKLLKRCGNEAADFPEFFGYDSDNEVSPNTAGECNFLRKAIRSRETYDYFYAMVYSASYVERIGKQRITEFPAVILSVWPMCKNWRTDEHEEGYCNNMLFWRKKGYWTLPKKELQFMPFYEVHHCLGVHADLLVELNTHGCTLAERVWRQLKKRVNARKLAEVEMYDEYLREVSP